MRKQVVFTIICFALLLGGCGVTTSSSTPVAEDEKEQREPVVNEKLIHRFEQRGFEVESMVHSELTQDTGSSEEVVEQSPVERMAELDDWTAVELVINDQTLFNEQTLQYFEEDLYENYPPPKKDTIDVLATIIYESDTGFILDGLIRNGFSTQSFTLEQLQPMVLKLLTANNQVWILTTLGEVEGIKGVKSGEAVPFRLVIPKNKIRIPAFDHVQFSYHVAVEQPKVETGKDNLNEDKKEE